LKDKRKLAGNKVVGTILFNLGVEKMLNQQGIKFIRTDVGDAYVYHAMKVGKLSMGGETSGHINFADIWCTGDGLVVALMVLEMLSQNDKTLIDLASTVELYPQININTEANAEQKKQLFANQEFIQYVKKAQAKNKDFRIIVRPSGTENIVRVTVEGANKSTCEGIAADIVQKIKSVL
jgi:phosphoglucosamine mutase